MENPKKVLSQFGLEDKYARLTLTAGAFNKNWIVENKYGKYILKRRPLKLKQRSLTECDICLFLKNKLITAEPISTLDKKYIYKEGQGIYSLFKFIEGKKYNGGQRHLLTIAKSMALFHNQTIGYEKRTAFKGSVINWYRQEIKKYQGSRKKCFEQLGNLSINNLETYQDLSKTIIHWDIHGGNLLIIKGKAVFFDFEYAHKDWRILDLGNTLALLTANDQKKIHYNKAFSFIQMCKINNKKFKVFIDKYCQHNPLNDNEILALPDAMILAWIAWSLYTMNELGINTQMEKRALFFPQWVDKNRDQILELIT